MWVQIIITALLTTLVTLLVASLLVMLVLLPHIERKIEQLIKQSAMDIERDLRTRALSMFRPKSLTRSFFGSGTSPKPSPLDPDEDPYLSAPTNTEEL